MKTRMIIKREGGAAAVETAIVLPVLVLLLFGIIEFGILLYNKAMITNACREGARTGIVFAHDLGVDPDDLADDTCHPDDTTIIDKVNQYLQTFLITFGGPNDWKVDIRRYKYDYTVYPPTKVEIGEGDETAGDALEVTVRYQYGYLVLSHFMGGSDFLNLGTTVNMRFE
jgi:hypothetical protein